MNKNKKPFALVSLKDLSVTEYDDRTQVIDALTAMNMNGERAIPVAYFSRRDCYVSIEYGGVL